MILTRRALNIRTDRQVFLMPGHTLQKLLRTRKLSLVLDRVIPMSSFVLNARRLHVEEQHINEYE